MTDMPFVPVGRVVKTHGLKGEVSVASAAGASLSLLEGVPLWFVPPAPGVPRSAKIVSVRPGPKGPLVKFDVLTDVDVASAVVGRELLVREEDVPEHFLDEDVEDDFVGYTVTDPAHGLIGKVVETIITGANDVWVVHGPLGEVLIPVIDDVVLEVDDAALAVTVKLLDGLLPGEGVEA